MIQKEQLKELIDKYQKGQCTEEETALLEDWYLQWNEQDRIKLSEDQLLDARLRSLNQLEPVVGVRSNKKLWPRIAAAAAVLLVVGASLFFFNRFASAPRHPDEGQDPALAGNDIKPGSNKAYLTLTNGKRLSLTDAANGALAKEAGVEITKTADGQVVYKTASDISGRINGRHPELVSGSPLNTIETPRGGQYQIRLPDGSKVWLNAASKLIYPVSFTGRGQRVIELSGEAYFEIFKNKLQPFVVKSKNQEVTVLGTHFNINTYADEPNTKTTLLEGVVRISALRHPEPVMPVKAGTGPQNSKGGGPDLHQDDVGERNGIILKPGEQATLQNNKIEVKEVNAEESIAWKNGKFVFANETIESIMRKIARWYNVEVEIKDVLPYDDFSGSMGRAENIMQVLHKIELTNKVHFKIEGRKIIVTK